MTYLLLLYSKIQNQQQDIILIYLLLFYLFCFILSILLFILNFQIQDVFLGLAFLLINTNTFVFRRFLSKVQLQGVAQILLNFLPICSIFFCLLLLTKVLLIKKACSSIQFTKTHRFPLISKCFTGVIQSSAVFILFRFS